MDNKAPEVYQRIQAWKEKNSDKITNPDANGLLYDILWLLYLEFAQIRNMMVQNEIKRMDELWGGKYKLVVKKKSHKKKVKDFLKTVKRGKVSRVKSKKRTHGK